MYSRIAKILTFWTPFKHLRRQSRNALTKCLTKQISNIIFRKEFKRFLDLYSGAKDICLVFDAIPFDIVQFMRPQQLAMQFAKLGHLVFYTDEHCLTCKKITVNLYRVNPQWILDKRVQSSKTCYYLNALISNHETNSLFDQHQKNVQKQKLSDCNQLQSTNNNFHVIYDLPDEIHPDISGNVSVQLERYNNLEKISPTLIVATAKNLYDSMAARFPAERVLLNQNGVVLEDWLVKNDAQIPDDLAKIVAEKRPIVGYHGSMAPWLNYDLLDALHQQRPEYNFVYIGIDYGGALKKLKIRNNVYFLGPKNYDILASYGVHFDCCIIPFLEGEIAKATSPVKLFEYMAMKKPVVVTKDLQECYGYEGVLVSQSSDEFIKNVDKAIQLGKDQDLQDKLYHYAQQNTWEKRARDIVTRLKELINE